MSAPTLAALLAEHDWRWSIRDSRTGEGVRIACTASDCDWHAERVSEGDDVWAAHWQHLASVVAAWLREDAQVERAARAMHGHSRLGDAAAALAAVTEERDQ